MKKLAIPIVIILLGTALRFHALAQDIRLQPDEAWFSTFARAAALNGDWWLPGPLDKPPLAIYLNALAQVFVGDHELVARLPGVLASILLMPVMYVLAKIYYGYVRAHSGAPLPMLSLLLTALSPIAIAYSATAFTDGPMLLFVTLALWMAARNRWGWSGLWLALGIASKFQALFYLPLLLALGWSMETLSVKHLLRFLLPFVAVIAILLIWDAAREGTSLFALAAANNNPARLIRSNEIIPRLQTWIDYAQTLLGSGWLTMLVLLNTLVTLALRVLREPRQRGTMVDLVLFNFVVSYGLLHWLVAFNTYDRYLLLILPPVILLVVRGIHALSTLPVGAHCNAPLRRATTIVITIILIPAAISASEGRSAINSGHYIYTGIDDLAHFLNQQPVATVIYDHWLGWELGYYLGQWHDKRLTYYPTPNALVQDALALCETGPRFLPVPKTHAPGPWLEALREAGFEVTLAYEDSRFAAYRLMPPWAVSGVLSSEAGADPCVPLSPRSGQSPPDNAPASRAGNRAASPAPPASS